MVSVKAIGLDTLRASFAREVKYFQADQRKAMRKATNMMAGQVRRTLRSGSILKSGTGRRRPKIGPLHRSIKTRVRPTKTSLIGVIRYAASGFYGPMHELGVNATVTRKSDRQVIFVDGRFVTLQRRRKDPKTVTYQLRIPARPVLEPVARRNADKAVEIMGDSFSVFTGGRRV